jgi:hypothetical protein
MGPEPEVTALAALVLVLVLPTIAGAVVLADAPGPDDAPPHSVPADLALARGLAVGLSTWLLGSGLLVRTTGLTATSAWVWDAVVAAASVVVLLLPASRARLRAVLGPLLRRTGEVVGLTALAFAPLALVMIRTSWSPIGSTPWYYYGLARQIADQGSLPTTSIEFGTATPFLNDYHLFSTSTAMLLVQDPGRPITVILEVALVCVVLVGVGAAALTSAFGVGRLTSLLAVPLMMTTGIGAVRLVAYRPESMGIGLALLVAALALDWLARGGWRSLLAAALLVACLSQVHGIAAVSSAVMVTAAALACLRATPWRRQLQRTGLALVALLGAVVVTGLLFHESSGTVHAGGLIDRGGLADPTWEFFRAARANPPSMPPTNGWLLHDTLRDLYNGSWWWIAPVAVLAAAGLWIRRRDIPARRVLWFALWTVVGLALVSSVFMFGWKGYVPRRTGASRFPLEVSLVFPSLLAIGLGCLLRHLRGTRVSDRLRRPGLVVLAVLTVAGLVSITDVAVNASGGSISRSQLATWESLPLTSKDVVLANGYTEGFIPDATPAQGLLDGRAPYTFDAQLRRANGLLRGADAFFADPGAHWDYLAQNGVTWVVVGDPSTYALSTGNTWDVPSPLSSLDRCSGLRQVVDTPSLKAYRVVDPAHAGCSGS